MLRQRRAPTSDFFQSPFERIRSPSEGRVRDGCDEVRVGNAATGLVLLVCGDVIYPCPIASYLGLGKTTLGRERGMSASAYTAIQLDSVTNETLTFKSGLLRLKRVGSRIGPERFWEISDLLAKELRLEVKKSSFPGGSVRAGCNRQCAYADGPCGCPG